MFTYVLVEETCDFWRGHQALTLRTMRGEYYVQWWQWCAHVHVLSYTYVSFHFYFNSLRYLVHWVLRQTHMMHKETKQKRQRVRGTPRVYRRPKWRIPVHNGTYGSELASLKIKGSKIFKNGCVVCRIHRRNTQLKIVVTTYLWYMLLGPTANRYTARLYRQQLWRVCS